MDRDIIIGILESINNNDQMNYINVFINELCNKYKCIDLAYIPLIESDRWYIHDYHLDKIGFFSGSLRKDITTKLDQYKLGLPIIDDIATLFPEERSANRILTEGTIQNFYKHFIPKVRNHMLSIHQKWHHHVIAPLTLKDHLYGHIILCIKNETTAADKNTLIHDLEDYRILLSICLASENEKPCTHIYEEILKTTLSLGSTSVLTGFVSKSFLSQLFRLAIKVIPEADYGSAILISNGLWIFDDAIGHDIEQLKKIPISRDIYEKNMSFVNNSQEIEPGVFLIDSILQRHNETGVYNPIFSEINKASKPIKTSMQVHITNKGFLFGIISLDISPNNPLSFSRESARVLKQIGSIASLLFGYNTIFNYTESFCNITDLIANYVLKKATIKEGFTHKFLELLVQSIPEANYGSIYIKRNDKIKFIDCIGHNNNVLKNLDIPSKCFKEIDTDFKRNAQLVAISVYHNVQDFSVNEMSDTLRKEFIAATRPSKETVVSHYKMGRNTILNISLDIAKSSFMNFSSETIRMIKAFSNIGFVYIANQLYSEEVEILPDHLPEEERIRPNSPVNPLIQTKVRKDPLTQLFTHTYIMNLLGALLDEQTRMNKPVSVVLIDIDDFTTINKTYGHHIGDYILQSMALILKSALIQMHIGRFGNDEFIVVLPNSDIEEAKIYAQVTTQKIKNTHYDMNISLTISCGIAMTKTNHLNQLIESALSQLNEAKKIGGDCIITEETHE